MRKRGSSTQSDEEHAGGLENEKGVSELCGPPVGGILCGPKTVLARALG